MGIMSRKTVENVTESYRKWGKAVPEALVYTTDEVAAQLKVTRRTVQSWVVSGKLKAMRIGREFRIEAAELEAFKERARQAATGEEPSRRKSRRS
jgi:putative molybdopterin biosynthesis protein